VACVLIVTASTDQHAMVVEKRLRRDGHTVTWVDIAEFPADSTIAATLNAKGAWRATWDTGDRTINLSKVDCAWLRRPGVFRVEADMSGGMRDFCLAEARLGFGGVLAHLKWLSHPFAIAEAEYKPRQLSAAVASGLLVPPTTVVNSFDAAERFIVKHGPAVAMKPFTQGAVDHNGTRGVIYTTRITLPQLGPSIARTAHLLQAWIEPAAVIRATVVDDQVHAASVVPDSDTAKIDYRRDLDGCTVTGYDLPARVAVGLVKTVKRLGLRFSTADVILDHEGRYWFIDLNPNGQWLWVEEMTEAPIAEAIASALTRPPT
jgi:hypothetical protein